jgi:hypothetical protein
VPLNAPPITLKGSSYMSTTGMTREQFLSQKTEAERRIRHRVVPVGIIYSIRLLSVLAGVFFSVLLWTRFATGVRIVILSELGICVLLFVVGVRAERDSKRQFVELALKCPECQSCMVFNRAEKTVETGYCYHCGRRFF